MKTTLAMLTLCLGMAAGTIHAQTATPATPASPATPATKAVAASTAAPASAAKAAKPEANSQQNRMAACNQEAGGKALKGEERQAFMKQCLSNKPATQQDRMKSCNADAKDMKGDDRKKFMSECLKKK